MLAGKDEQGGLGEVIQACTVPKFAFINCWKYDLYFQLKCISILALSLPPLYTSLGVLATEILGNIILLKCYLFLMFFDLFFLHL